MSILYNSNDSSVSMHLWTAIEDGKYWYGSAPNPGLQQQSDRFDEWPTRL